MTRKLRYLGPSLLVVAGGCLALAWERIPQRWVVHWGPHGRADGVAHKSPAALFLPLLLGFAVWAQFETIASMMERTGPVPEFSRVAALPLRLLSIGIAALFATVAVALPLLQPEGPQPIVGAALLLVVGPLAAGLVYVARATARLKRAGHHELEGWHGVVYRNANDDRLLVPKPSGLGYTLNFAKPAAYWLLALLLLPGVLSIVLLFALR